MVRVGDLMFVCAGNVCRSPFAERIMQHALSELPGHGVSIASRGLVPLEGWAIAEETAAIIDALGADSSGHRARRLERSDLEKASLVLTATADQRSRVVQELPRAVQYTFTVRQLGHALEHGFPQGVPTPNETLTSRERLDFVRELVRSNLSGGSTHPEDLDVLDPFARRKKYHVMAASEMLPSLNVLAQAMGGTPIPVPDFIASAAATARSRRGRHMRR